MTFLTFPRYSSYSMWVRWANLQSFNVKYLQDSICQKWLKSVHFWLSYSKNKNVSVFLDTVYWRHTHKNMWRTSLLGDAEKRSMYSSVNQPIQPASTIARCSLSPVTLPCLSILASEGIVLMVSAIVETTINSTDMIASTWHQHASSSSNDICSAPITN